MWDSNLDQSLNISITIRLQHQASYQLNLFYNTFCYYHQLYTKLLDVLWSTLAFYLENPSCLVHSILFMKLLIFNKNHKT